LKFNPPLPLRERDGVRGYSKLKIGTYLGFGICDLGFRTLCSVQMSSGGVNGSARVKGKRAGSYFHYGEAI
jgi:hypothetical protein